MRAGISGGALRLPWKAAGLPGYQRGPWVSAAAPDPRPVLRVVNLGDLRQLRPWGPLRATVAGAGVDPLRDLRVVNLVDFRRLRQLLR